MPAHLPTPIRIGADTGGTFTDLLCLDHRGLRVHKLRSVPADPSRAILEGIRHLVGDPLPALEITHGSTVATNAVLERKGARTALLTTAGFEDVLRIGRQTRPELYNFQVTRPDPLIPATQTFGIPERLAADGSVLTPLDAAHLHALIPTLHQLAIESVAVCFLHSYANPAHEAQAATILRAAGLRVSTSHEVLPEYREFERWATTAVNAYVSPLMARYLDRLQTELTSTTSTTSTKTTLRIMQSNGGSISAARAGAEAVQTILSGPAAGVIGAQALGAASGFHRLLTFDMGGTSTDVSLLNGALATTNDSLVGDLPVRLPVLDIHTVGAGGGSVASIDAGLSLRVGPRSAGATPGPACFGLGDELTVTDANLLLGRLDPAFFLGGRMALDLPRTQAIARTFAARLNLTPQTLALGILRIANANMERALRVVSVQRGYDPRDFALLAFGGAGGLHACDLADSLEIRTVLIPEHSGVLSALGMLLADVAKHYSASILLPTDTLTPQILTARLAPLQQKAEQDLAAEGFSKAQVQLQPTAAMRYIGQAFEVDVPFTPDPTTLAQTFHHAHAQRYGYSDPNRPTELVQLRLRATGQTIKPTLTQATHATPQTAPPPTTTRRIVFGQPPPATPPTPQTAPPPTTTRRIVFGKRPHETPIHHRTNLAPGHHGPGPAMLLTNESTNIVPPNWTWQIDPTGTLQLHRSPTTNNRQPATAHRQPQ